MERRFGMQSGCGEGTVWRAGIAAAALLLFVLFMLPPAACGSPRRLNNFVVELAEVDISRMGARGRFEAEMDMDGWIYVLVEGEGDIGVSMTAGGETGAVLNGPGEAMRYIPAGPVRFDVVRGRGASPERLSVRRVAEVFAYNFQSEGCVSETPHVGINHSWENWSEAYLHSANVVTSRPASVYEPYARRWQKEGGRWLRRQSIRPLWDENVDPAEFFSEIFRGQVWDGAIIDELTNADWHRIERYADGISRFSGDPGAEGKELYFWIYSLGSRGGESAIRYLSTVCPETLKSFWVEFKDVFHGSGHLYTEAGSEGPPRTRQVGLELEPGVEYTLSAYMSGEDVVNSSRTGLFIIDQGWHNEYGRLQPVEGNSGWQRYEASFIPEPGMHGAYQVLITRPEGGSLRIDAVQLERGGKAGTFTAGGKNKINNPSFEEGMYAWMSGTGEAKPLVDAVVDNGHSFVQEMYLLSELTEEKAAERIDRPLELLAWAFDSYAGLLQRHVMIAPLLYDARPGAWCGNFYPHVDYKVFLDMQMHAMANREGLEDLRGVGLWAGHYARKETLAWYGELLRHYCIEGNTGRLSDDPYILAHLRDPGFAEGLREWDTRGNVEAVNVKDMPEGAFVGEGRFPPSVPAGDTIIRTVRGEGDAANSFGQKIRDLEPGRLYFLKVFSADPEYSDRLIQADISIQGGEIRPEGERTAQFSEEKWNHVWRVRRQPEEVHWTMHFRVFRAAEEEGYLEISDVEPGEVYWDFIQIAPFFEK